MSRAAEDDRTAMFLDVSPCRGPPRRTALGMAFGLQPDEPPESRVGERHHRSHDDHEDDVCGDQTVPRPFSQLDIPMVEGHLPDEDQQDADRVDEHEAHERGEEHDGAYAAVDAERAHRGGRTRRRR